MRNVLLLFICLFSAMACSDLDSDNKKPPVDGQWSLVSVMCLCPPIELEENESKWTFDSATLKLTVENTFIEDLHTIPDAGTYDYSESSTTVTLEGIVYDLEFQGEEMILSHMPELDGPIIRFVPAD